MYQLSFDMSARPQKFCDFRISWIWSFVIALFIVFVPQSVSAQTIEELQAEILILIQQIQVLQSQLTDQGSAEIPQFCGTFPSDLYVGSMNSDVETLQMALQREGLSIIESELVGSYFGVETEGAVKLFQERYRSEILSPYGLQWGTGYVGPTTRMKLYSLYGC